MLQVVHLFGYLPNMLELSCNICAQGCEYCYAKTWKHEQEPIEKVINNILSLETKAEGLLPFLIRKRSPITVSNRTDILCAPDWRERLYALKKLGFPLYIETKLNKDYKDLADILDKEKDGIYQTVTGYNNRYEERNILTAEEKIEAAKWFNERGFYHTLAVNPFMPDKVTTEEIKKMITYIKPKSFVMRDYHRTSKTIHWKLYREEYPEGIMEAARKEIRDFCIARDVIHDIDYYERLAYPEIGIKPELSGRVYSNEIMFRGNHFVWHTLLHKAADVFNRHPDWHSLNMSFDWFLGFFDKQVTYFKDCVIKNTDYSPTSGKTNLRWEKKRFGIVDFLRQWWNWKKLSYVFDYNIQQKDENGNITYIRFLEGFKNFSENKNFGGKYGKV